MQQTLFLSFILLFICGTLMAQDNGDKKYPEGKINYSILFNSKNKGVFEPEFNGYKPDADLVKFLKANRKGLRMKIVMGFWCEDSQIYVPRMLKVLKDAGWDVEDDQVVKIYGVDVNKQAGFEGFKALNITNVPTFIVYYNNDEIGRIVEAPKETLELDLANIIKKIQR